MQHPPPANVPTRLLDTVLLVAGFTLIVAGRALAAEASSVAAARNLFEGGQYAEARAALEKIIASEPRNAEALFYLGWTVLRLHQSEESAKLLERATALDPTRSLYFHVLGDAYGETLQRASLFAKPGWARKCLAAYDRAVALDPDNLDARAARFSYYSHAPGFVGGGMDKARAEAEEIRRRDPVRGAQALVDLYVSDKRYPEAFAVIDELVARNPDNKPALYQLGRLAAITAQQLDRGAAALETYLQYLPQGREPSLASAHWRLGMIREKAGDRAAARAEYAAALKLAPDFAIAREALKKLQ